MGAVTKTFRKLLLTVHLVGSLGWLAVVTVVIVLGAAAVGSHDADEVHTAVATLSQLDDYFLGTVSPIAALSGILLGLTSRWGLLRHWWVAVKLVTTIAIMICGALSMHQRILQAAAIADRTPADRVPPVEAILTPLVTESCLAAAALLAMTVLSLFKPARLTPLGRRRRRLRKTRRVVVTDTRTVALGVVELELSHPRGRPLPAWQPGAHVDLVLPSGLVRQYSLCGDPSDRGSYRVAVRRDSGGRGGSVEVHRLRPGDRLRVRGPRNTFPLRDADRYLFIAGGIGITPLKPMIEHVAAAGSAWRLIYIGRTPASMPYGEELAARYPGRVTLIATRFQGRPDVAGLLDPTATVYACGPESLLSALEQAVPADRLHVERFAARPAGGAAFDVELRESGQSLHVPADRSLLEVIREVRPDLDSSCEQGICGDCAVKVVGGTPDHRDLVLDDRTRTDVIYPCVSRSATPRLVLDL